MVSGLLLSEGGLGDDEPGGGCLEEVGGTVRPEVPALPDRPISRARCGRGMYLPSLPVDVNPGLALSSLSRATELYFSSSLRPSSFSKDTRRRYCRLPSISLAKRAARASRCRKTSEFPFSKGMVYMERLES